MDGGSCVWEGREVRVEGVRMVKMDTGVWLVAPQPCTLTYLQQRVRRRSCLRLPLHHRRLPLHHPRRVLGSIDRVKILADDAAAAAAAGHVDKMHANDEGTPEGRPNRLVAASGSCVAVVIGDAGMVGWVGRVD